MHGKNKLSSCQITKHKLEKYSELKAVLTNMVGEETTFTIKLPHE